VGVGRIGVGVAEIGEHVVCVASDRVLGRPSIGGFKPETCATALGG